MAKELPPKTEILHNLTLGKEQTDLYETIRAAMDKRVREAILQGLQVAHSVRQPESPLHRDFAGAEKDFLMVITSRDLLLVSGEATQRLMPDSPLFSSDTPGAERLLESRTVAEGGAERLLEQRLVAENGAERVTRRSA